MTARALLYAISVSRHPPLRIKRTADGKAAVKSLSAAEKQRVQDASSPSLSPRSSPTPSRQVSDSARMELDVPELTLPDAAEVPEQVHFDLLGVEPVTGRLSGPPSDDSHIDVPEITLPDGSEDSETSPVEAAEVESVSSPEPFESIQDSPATDRIPSEAVEIAVSDFTLVQDDSETSDTRKVESTVMSDASSSLDATQVAVSSSCAATNPTGPLLDLSAVD